MNLSTLSRAILVFVFLFGLPFFAFAQNLPMKLSKIQAGAIWANNGRKNGVETNDIFAVVRQTSKHTVTIGIVKVAETLQSFSRLEVIELYGTHKLRVGDLLLPQTQTNSESEVLLIGNTDSRFIHKETLGNSPVTHLPHSGIRKNIDDLSTAISRGWKKCPICFQRPNPKFRDYLLEKQLGLEAAAQLRYYYPLSVDETLSAHVTKVGNQVLSRWIFPTKGYSYKFAVLESGEINAFACPGGIVYVTTSLLDILESDAELEAILAHEIGHVENRHGLKLFKRKQELSDLLSMVSALLSGVTDVDLNPLITFSKQLLFSGHGKDLEEEADFLSALYLEKTPLLDSKALGLVLRKFEDMGGRIGGFLSSHPKIAERVLTVESTKVFHVNLPGFAGSSTEVDIRSLGVIFHLCTIDNKTIRLYGKLKKAPDTFHLFRENMTLTGLKMKYQHKTLRWKFVSLDMYALRTELTVDFSISMDSKEFIKSGDLLGFSDGNLVDHGGLERIEIMLRAMHPKLVSKKIKFVRSN